MRRISVIGSSFRLHLERKCPPCPPQVEYTRWLRLRMLTPPREEEFDVVDRRRRRNLSTEDSGEFVLAVRPLDVTAFTKGAGYRQDRPLVDVERRTEFVGRCGPEDGEADVNEFRPR